MNKMQLAADSLCRVVDMTIKNGVNFNMWDGKSHAIYTDVDKSCATFVTAN